METKKINDTISAAMNAVAEMMQGKGISNIRIPTDLPKEVREHIMNCLWAIKVSTQWKH